MSNTKAEKQPVNKKTFTVKVGDKDRSLAVLRPTHRVEQEGRQVHARAFRDAVDAGAIVRPRAEKILREQNLWGEDRKKELEELGNKLKEAQRKLAKGGMKLSEARELALAIRKDRGRQAQLMAERDQLDAHTAEAAAHNAYFNYLVSRCTVDAFTGKHYWEDYDAYLAAENDPVVGPAASALSSMLYGLDPDWEKKLPENAFLLKYGFADDKLRLVNKQGKLVDEEGRLVNEEGRFVDEAGRFVDRDGHLVDEEGNPVEEFTPFVDDEGKPVGEVISPPEVPGEPVSNPPAEGVAEENPPGGV